MDKKVKKEDYSDSNIVWFTVQGDFSMVRKIESFSEEELIILKQDLHCVMSLFINEIKSLIRCIRYNKKRFKKYWKKNHFMELMLDISYINKDLYNLVAKVQSNMFTQLEINHLYEYFQWWIDGKAEIHELIKDTIQGYNCDTSNTFFYAKKICKLLTSENEG